MGFIPRGSQEPYEIRIKHDGENSLREMIDSAYAVVGDAKVEVAEIVDVENDMCVVVVDTGKLPLGELLLKVEMHISYAEYGLDLYRSVILNTGDIIINVGE